LNPSEVPNLDKARANVDDLMIEIMKRLIDALKGQTGTTSAEDDLAGVA
jgi:hypothetical protein